MSPSRPVRRVGVAGMTVALLTSTALAAAPAMAGGPAPDQPAAPEESIEIEGGSVGEDAPAADDSPEAEDAVPAEGSDTEVVVAETPETPTPAEELVVEEQIAVPGALIVIGLSGSYDASGAHALLDRINEIRAEAAAEGITIDGVPVSGTPLEWSPELESVAQQRAAEVSFSFSHERPNGSGRLTALEGNGLELEVLDENLALGEGTFAAVESWYAEKQAYLDYLATGLDTGNFARYVTLISDEYSYVGIASFTLESLYEIDLEDPTLPLERSRAAEVFGAEDGARTIPGMGYVAGTVGAGGTAVVALFSATPSGEAAALPDGPATVPVEVTPDYITGSVDGPTTLVEGETGQAVASAVAGVDPWGGSTTIQGDISGSIDIAWSSSDESVAVVDGNGTVTAVAPGTAQITATTGDVVLGSFAVTVEAAPAVPVSVEPPAPVATDSGSAPALPGSVSAAMSDGSEAELPVAWEPVDPALYGAREGGSFEVLGSAEGWGEPVAVTVEVRPAEALRAEGPLSAATEAGAAPQLPAAAAVEWSNGETTEEPVEWSAMDPQDYLEGGSFSVEGTVCGLPVLCEVTVSPAQVTAVSNPAVITTPSGTAPQLPATVTASMSNGTERELPVTWEQFEPAAYSALEGGTFEVAGTVEGLDQPVSITVDVEAAQALETSALPDVTTEESVAPALPATVGVRWSNGDQTEEPISWEPIDPASYDAAGSFEAHGSAAGLPVTCTINVVEPTVSSIAPSNALETPSGTAPALPATVSASMSNGTERELSVAWDAMDPALYTAREGGSFIATGVADGWSEPVEVAVNVVPAFIESIAELAPASTVEAVAPTLPESVEVTWSNGEVEQAPISWNAVDAASYGQPGTFEATGSVAGWNEPVVCAVDVTAKTPLSTEELQPVQTEAGVAPVLPEYATVSWNNGTESQETIAWDPVDPESFHNGGTFVVEGLVEAAASKVAVEVVVAPATAVSCSEVAVTTPAGIAPQLPSTIEVLWSNGDKTTEAVAWPVLDAASYGTPGELAVEGTFENAEVNLIAQAIVGVTDPVIVGIDPLTPVETSAGSRPVLPTEVTALLSDGSMRQLPITWSEIPAALYHNTGSFSVEGSADGYDGPVSVQVNVSAALPQWIQTVYVTTTPRNAPVLPDTVRIVWANGETTYEPVEWKAVSPTQYSRPGTFTVKGIAAGQNVQATVTVAESQERPASTDVSDDIAPTDDATMQQGPLITSLSAAGAALIAVAAGLLHRRRRSRN